MTLENENDLELKVQMERRDRIAKHLAVAAVLYASVVILLASVVFGLAVRLFRMAAGF